MNQNNSWNITIGSQDISHLLIEGGKITKKIGSNDSATLSFKLDFEALASIDFSQLLHIWINSPDKQGHVSILYGFTSYANVEEDRVTIRVEGIKRQLQEYRTGGTFGSGISKSEILYYLLKSVNPDSVDPEYIDNLDGQGKLSDQVSLFRRRTFIYILPCMSLSKMDTPTYFGDSLIYDWTREPNRDDKIISASFPSDSMPTEWQHPIRMRLPVQCNDFVEAFNSGIERSDETLDAISLILNRTSLVTRSGSTWSTYNRNILGLDTRRVNWAYVREIHPNVRRFWIRWFDGNLHKKEDSDSVYLTCGSLFDQISNLVSSTARVRDKQQVQYIGALRALRQCHESGHPVDGVSHLFRAIEYLAGTQPMPQIIEKDNLRNVKRKLEQSAYSILLDSGYDEESARHLAELIKDNVPKVNDHPLRNKWNILAKTVEAPYTEEDGYFLWKRLRSARNLDIHGNRSTITRSEVLRGYAIVERVIFALLERLKKETGVWYEAADAPFVRMIEDQ